MAGRASKIWEAAYPYALGSVVGGIVFFLPLKTPTFLHDHGFNVLTIYGALQDLVLFGSGIFFSVYVFTMAPAAGFIQKLERLSLYLVFRRYALETILLGLASWAALTPLAAAKDVGSTEGGLMAALAVFTLSGVAAFLSSAFRVGRIFFFWASR